MIEFFKSQKDMKRQRYQEVYMRSNWRKQMMISALALTLSATNVAPVFASAAPDGKTNAVDIAQTMGTTAQWNRWEKEWETLKNDWTQISLSPGSNATELNFAWYTPKQTNDDHSNANVPKLIIGEGRNMKNAKVYEAEQTEVKDEQDNNGETYNSNKVTATGLKENKTYYYSYDNGNGYTKPAEYTTKSTNNFSFAFVGDPQIGSSNELKGKDTKEFYDAQSNAVKSDAFNWSSTLNAALEKTDDQLSFVVSAGDQIQTTKKKSPNKDASKSEIEYTGYLSPEALKSLPVATTVGNHDADNANYTYHFNRTNASELGSNKVVGGDYYFKYGNALFIMLNTQDTNVAEHKQFIEQTVAANKDCKWRIVTLHQDIYGSGYDHSDSDGMVLRTQLTPLMDKYDIDVVLQGHDHTYSRTYQLQSDGQAHDKFAKTENTANYAKENNCYEIVDTTKGGTVVNPKGTVYLEANSATGSKFYNLITAKQDFISERSQTWTPSYSVVNVTDDSFEVTTYDADTGKVLDGSSSYKIVKKAEDTKKEDTKEEDTTAVQAKDQTITATESYKKSETSKAFKLNAKTNGNGKLTYTTSNKAVATVDAAGKVTVKGPGVAKITVKAAATANYKAASKTVTVTVAPKKQSISLVNKIKKQLTIKWKKNTKASGYQVVYSTNKKFTGKKTVRKAKTTTSYKIKGLKKGKKYYVKVRSYKTVNGKRIYGAYSTAQKATIK